jgi:replicative DNA helicase
MLKDIETENAVLSSLYKYGLDSYHEIATVGLSEVSFSDSANKIVFKCFEYLFDSKSAKDIDFPSLINSCKALGYENWIQDKDLQKDILEKLSVSTKLGSVKPLAQKLRKLEIGNKISAAADKIQEEVKYITGEEKLGDIFGIVEQQLSNLSSFLTDTSEDPVDIAGRVEDHIEFLATNQVDQLGIPTGFPIFDKYIGGGLRKHAITVIGARMKTGKSTLCKNIAYNVSQLGIPVLYLDTEMETEDQINRLVSSVASVPIDQVESGKFSSNLIDKQKVKDAVNEIKQIRFQHKTIGGYSIEAQLAIVRKWLIRTVGLTKEGRAKDCLLVYDYIKMMDSKDLGKVQEHQALGFLMTALQNFAVKYDIPILTAAQLNRDGISSEDTSAIGGSDRIAMYGSSISLLKWKTEEELAAEDYQWGNQKLIPIISRYGPAMDTGDYINIWFEGDKNKMCEKGTRANSQQNQKPKPKKKSGSKKEDSVEEENPYSVEF